MVNGQMDDCRNPTLGCKSLTDTPR
jgi:hypothetical protein